MNSTPRSIPAQRIGPARVGQPASNRNFSLSSAGGPGAGSRPAAQSSNLGNGIGGTGSDITVGKSGEEGRNRVVQGGVEEERRRRKIEAWGESYVRLDFSIHG